MAEAHGAASVAGIIAHLPAAMHGESARHSKSACLCAEQLDAIGTHGGGSQAERGGFYRFFPFSMCVCPGGLGALPITHARGTRGLRDTRAQTRREDVATLFVANPTDLSLGLTRPAMLLSLIPGVAFALATPKCALCVHAAAAAPLSVRMSDPAPSPTQKARIVKAAFFAGLTAAAVAKDAPPAATLARVVGGSIVCVLPGAFDTHLAVSYGYGASLAWQAALIGAPLGGSLAGRWVAGAYALYGLKVCVFQGLRDASVDYVEKVLAPSRAKAVSSGRKQSVVSRAPFVLSVGLLLSTFAFPLSAACGGAIASSTRAAGVTCGGAVAMAGLLLQTVADFQKLAFKRTDAGFIGAPMLGRGVWRFSRHPNYLGEVVFHAGVLVAGLSGSRSLAAAWLSVLAPTVFMSIMLSTTRGLEKRQRDKYGEVAEYAAYVESTPALFLWGRKGPYE